MNHAPMKVGIDVRLAHWPGIGRYIEETVAHMVAAYPHTTFVLYCNASGPATLRQYADPELQRRLQASNVQFVACDITPFSPSEPWQLAQLVRQTGVDVVHSPYINIPWSSKAQPPLVVTLHDFRHPDLALRWNAPRTWFKRAYYEVLTRLALRQAHTVVCVSRFLSKQIVHFSPTSAERVRTIHHAASADFRPLSPEQTRAMTDGWDLTQPYFLFVGTLKPHKNLLAVIHAMSLMSTMDVPPHVALVVAAADDSRYPEISAAIAQHGLASRVRLLGHVPKAHLPALYCGAIATLLPSDYESFGLPVVESMACGTPVVAAEQGALQEVGGRAAIYVPPTPAALAQAMSQLWHSPELRQQLIDKGFAQAATFSWSHAAHQLHAAYQAACASRTI